MEGKTREPRKIEHADEQTLKESVRGDAYRVRLVNNQHRGVVWNNYILACFYDFSDNKTRFIRKARDEKYLVMAQGVPKVSQEGLELVVDSKQDVKVISDEKPEFSEMMKTLEYAKQKGLISYNLDFGI